MAAGEEIVYLDGYSYSAGYQRSSGEVLAFTPSRVLYAHADNSPISPDSAQGQPSSVTIETWARSDLVGVAFGGAAEGDYDYPWVHGLPDGSSPLPSTVALRLTYLARDDVVVVPLESRGNRSGAATGEARWPLLQALLTVDLVASPASAPAGAPGAGRS